MRRVARAAGIGAVRCVWWRCVCAVRDRRVQEMRRGGRYGKERCAVLRHSSRACAFAHSVLAAMLCWRACSARYGGASVAGMRRSRQRGSSAGSTRLREVNTDESGGGERGARGMVASQQRSAEAARAMVSARRRPHRSRAHAHAKTKMCRQRLPRACFYCRPPVVASPHSAILTVHEGSGTACSEVRCGG